ncbi:ferredoxin [Streptomyces sp. NPDC059627]
MTLSIDPQRCQGHGRCSLISPELFDVSDDGLGVVLEPHPAPEYTAAVTQAIGNCPERAVSYAPDPDGQAGSDG